MIIMGFMNLSMYICCRVAYTSNPHTFGFGLNETVQFQALDRMESLIESMILNNGRKSKLPFQRGILISIKSTRMLYKELSQEGVQYLRTHRVNQDCLENTFSQTRRVGGEGAHPDAVQFINRIRILMMNKKTMHLVKNPNVISNENESFLFTSLATDLERDLSEDKTMRGFDDDMEDDDDDDDNDVDIEVTENLSIQVSTS